MGELRGDFTYLRSILFWPGPKDVWRIRGNNQSRKHNPYARIWIQIGEQLYIVIICWSFLPRVMSSSSLPPLTIKPPGVKVEQVDKSPPVELFYVWLLASHPVVHANLFSVFACNVRQFKNLIKLCDTFIVFRRKTNAGAN